MTNPYRQKRETLSEFNARRAKEARPSRMSQVGATPAGKPNLERLRQNATEYTYNCPECRDVGWIVRETPKTMFSRRCDCWQPTYKALRKADDDIPI